MGQLQPNCSPRGVLEALAGSREMHLPGENCLANRPCPSLAVNSSGSRLAPQHLKILMIKLQCFGVCFPLFEMGMGFALCSLIRISPTTLSKDLVIAATH